MILFYSGQRYGWIDMPEWVPDTRYTRGLAEMGWDFNKELEAVKNFKHITWSMVKEKG